MLHPAVADCAVIGVPVDTWVLSVNAIVVLRDGAHADADELIAHARAHIASYKKPRSVEFTDAIPRKGFAVDYDTLDARYGGGGYPGGTTRSANATQLGQVRLRGALLVIRMMSWRRVWGRATSTAQVVPSVST
jgi:hypothetical protein